MSVQGTTQTPPVQTNEQTNTNVEGAPAATTAQPKPADDLNPKFAALARKEKALRTQAQALAAERQKMADLQAEIERANTWKQRLQQDPYSVLLETGLTADQVATLMLNQPDPQIQKLQQEILALKAAQDQSSNRNEELQKQQYEQAKKQITADVSALVGSDPQYETIKAMKAEAAVVELIEQEYNDTGRLMTNDEAAQAVEAYLVEELLGYTKIKKIQEKINPPKPPEETQVPAAPAQQQQTQIQKPQVPTLSNRMVPSTTKPLTDRERRERAILAFQGKLTT